LRSLSWLVALEMCADSPALDAETSWQMVRSILASARHIERYLSLYSSPNTHLLGEAMGLVVIGSALPEFRAASRWRRRGRRLAERALLEQTASDGVYFERSLAYQRYAAEMAAVTLIVAEAAGERVSTRFRARLEKAFEVLLWAVGPDGRMPKLGDEDGGWTLPFARPAPGIVSGFLALGAALFGRGDMKPASGRPSEEVLWLLGTKGAASLARTDSRKPPGSRLFRQGGIASFRTGEDELPVAALVHCAPIDRRRSAHAHADALALTLTTRAGPLLVDSGTCVYASSLADREQFRATYAHNTVVVDGTSQSIPGTCFEWHRTARVDVERWLSSKRFDLLQASHDGYCTARSPIRHRRHVLFVKPDYLLVEDHLVGKGQHLFEVVWHFAPALDVRITPEGIAVASSKGEGCLLILLDDDEFCLDPGGESDLGWYSANYGQKAPAPALRVSRQSAAPAIFRTILYTGPGRRCAAEERDGRLGVRGLWGEDVLITPASRADDAGDRDCNTDATWACVRRDPVGRVKSALMVDGSYLRAGGRDLLQSCDGLVTVHVSSDRIGRGIAPRGENKLQRRDARAAERQ
jgi:hypothetical protein